MSSPVLTPVNLKDSFVDIKSQVIMFSPDYILHCFDFLKAKYYSSKGKVSLLLDQNELCALNTDFRYPLKFKSLITTSEENAEKSSDIQPTSSSDQLKTTSESLPLKDAESSIQPDSSPLSPSIEINNLQAAKQVEENDFLATKNKMKTSKSQNLSQMENFTKGKGGKSKQATSCIINKKSS